MRLRRYPTNIAEGASRITKPRIIRSYEKSRSSVVELDTQFEIAIILDYYKKEQMTEQGRFQNRHSGCLAK